MGVQVEVVCAPHPPEQVQEALRAAAKQLAWQSDSVSVEVRPAEPMTAPRIAVLEFEMRRSAQSKVVDDILETVKSWAWEFCEETTIRFPKG